MIVGEKVALRPVRREELPLVYAAEQDPDLVALVDTEPYTPLNYEDWLKRWDAPPQGSGALFGIQQGVDEDGPLLGRCSLWRIDSHNRNAHVGISLDSRADRGKGYGREALALLVDYAFSHRGLHRLSLETYAHNAALRRSAEAVGFVAEGRLRQSGWCGGRFADEAIYGLLAPDWRRTLAGGGSPGE